MALLELAEFNWLAMFEFTGVVFGAFGDWPFIKFAIFIWFINGLNIDCCLNWLYGFCMP